MAFKNFQVNIIIRITFLFGGLMVLSWTLVNGEYLKSVYLGIFIFLLLLEFFYYVNKVNRDMNQFMMSIFHDDYTSKFDAGARGKSFKRLYDSMNEITRKYRAISKEKETRGQYLISLIEQVRVGIISYEPGGKVHLVNKAFRELLDAPAITQGTDLNVLQPELFGILNNASMDQRQLVRMRILNKEKEFSFQSSGFRMDNRDYNLVSVQDIREELDEREFEAWQKLIRVLTHEIMNSVTPIASLTGSLYDLLEDNGMRLETDGIKEKISTGLGAIKERSEGLLKFTAAYQSLARVPSPEIRTIQTKDLVLRLNTLFSGDLEQKGIAFIMDWKKAPKSFKADVELLDQVIINLIINAEDALSETAHPEIRIEVDENENSGYSMCFRISDNGIGIPDEYLDQIFIPFFTTKKEGSGIGLSLSRQIILMHKGVLNVSSKAGKGSMFEILL